MDAYRQMWEDALVEEVANITVDPKSRKSTVVNNRVTTVWNSSTRRMG